MERPAISLAQLNSLIKTAIADTFPDQYWITGEIADIKQNQRGHCYLELVEKEANATVAQIRATIWAYEFRAISSRFRKETGEPLRPGMKILFFAAVSFHEVYGISLNIRDIDPAYTMGEMARKKKEVIDRLRKEGLMDRNKSLPLPLVPQRIAVISSPTAAGYGDFFNHLDNNAYGYRFVHTLFPALMQGPEAENSIIQALQGIQKRMKDFDLAAIIRGGGSVIDLNCFDGYALASHVAVFPLPVLSGIGHEKDDTVVDIVSHTKMKTPTAVAEFIISGVRSFEETILDLESRLVSFAREFLKDEAQRFTALAQRLSLLPLRLASVHRNRLDTLQRELSGMLRQRFLHEKTALDRLEQAVRHLDPVNVLKRGYSITRHKEAVIKDSSFLTGGMIMETEFHDGKVTSVVQPGKEEKNRGKKQGTDLLPGFE